MNLPQINQQPGRQQAWLPYALLTIAPLCWAGNVVVARGIVDTFPPVSLAFWRWSLATMILLPFAGKQAMHDWKTVFTHWKMMALLSVTGISILYFALFPSLVAYFCWNKGVELIGPNRAGLFINLIPVFASFMAVVWLQEALEWFHLGGLLLVLTGMALFNR
ncbi:MAG: DMT family transporter [Thermodesulfobacteriota bacterium]